MHISLTELKYMLEFAKTCPIGPPAGQLSWGHIRELLAVNDSAARTKIAKQAVKNKWSRKELRREIKKIKSSDPKAVRPSPKEEPLIPLKGALDTYRVVIAKGGPWLGKPAIDLGFSNYLDRLDLNLGRFKGGDIVQVKSEIRNPKPETNSKRQTFRTFEPSDFDIVSRFDIRISNFNGAVDLYTYRAYLLDVTDADTHWYLIDLGFGVTTKQHLRLRGIDCPELNTRAGQEAKRFVERVLKRAKSITITTSKSDKYDRYLSDVFYLTGKGEHYLNQDLLDKGYAVRV